MVLVTKLSLRLRGKIDDESIHYGKIPIFGTISVCEFTPPQDAANFYNFRISIILDKK